MKYVIKSERIKNYLYCLGFNYIEVPDQTGKQDKVFLFEKDESLQRAISFFTANKKEQIEKKAKLVEVHKNCTSVQAIS